MKDKIKIVKYRNPLYRVLMNLRKGGASGDHGDKKKYSRKIKHNRGYLNI
tara:strand:- start:4406 stop:4555 length:150 start_codon:yes stop_codon:yes gene_type:complete